MRWLRRGALTLLGLGLVAAVALAAYFWRATPRHDGASSVKGIGAAVTIERDQDGIPTIRAASVEDAAFALGFVHAQDRLWQLETHRRIGSGRLAEAFGRGALDNDRFLRALGVKRAAQAQWAQLGTESQRVLQAYAAGINEWQHRHLAARPPEMLMLGVPPEDWTPADSLAWAIMMAWDLGANWSSELLRARLALTLPVVRIDQLLPPYPGEAPLVATDYAALMRSFRLGGALTAQRIDRLVAAAPPSGIEGVGSNNWVVAGSHTTTGAPLLANDPHLKITTPALWYFARIEVAGPGGFRSAGATMPGLPLVVLGQNEHIAWGFTNTNPDVQDLYLERFHPDDPMQVQTPAGWARLGSVAEDIAVKGAPSENLVVRVSRHGPLISDAGGVAAEIAGDTSKAAFGIALRWTALDADADPIAASLAMNRARSADEFVDAATRLWVAPMQNMAVADRQGRIAMVSPGRVPLRRADNDLKGLVPAPGWDPRYDWAGFVPAQQTPRQTPQDGQPQRGWIASANQRIHDRDYPHFLTSEWVPPYRQQRIEQLLRSRSKHSIDDMAAMQADVLSLATQRLLPWLQRAQSGHRLAPAARAALAGFDGAMRAEDAAPLIFTAWARQLTRAVFVDELGGPEVYERVFGTRAFRDALEGVLERDDEWWCDDKRTADVGETCTQLAGVALTRALDELAQRFGADVSRWRWGQAHAARSEHRPFSRIRALAPLFELRVPTGGDTWTINVGRVGMRPDGVTGELYLNEHAASLRAIYDLGDPARSRFMHSSGQSGLPWSRHYRSFAGPWGRVGYVPLWGSGEAPAASMTLRP